jgi:1-phosphofructokinase family hexose kinase
VITCLGLSPALDVTYRVDRVAVGSIHRPGEVLALPGGKSLNVARALWAVAHEVTAITVLGGFTGERIARALEADGVGARIVWQEHETRHCVSVLDENGGATEFYETAPAVTDDAWLQVAGILDDVAGGILAVSGSLPGGDRLDALAEALRARAARGVRVALDTHGGALALLLERVGPAVVKVNVAEASALVGEGDAVELAARLHRRGAGIAIVTDGRAGSAAVSADGSWYAEAPVAGDFAIGSGDCFLAGLVRVLDTGGGLPDALRMATATAAANTLVPGAAVFAPSEVDRLASEVNIRPAP